MMALTWKFVSSRVKDKYLLFNFIIVMPISSFQAVLKDILNVFLCPITLYPSIHHHPTFQQLVSVYPIQHCVMAQKNAPLALMKQNVKVNLKAFL